MNRLRSWPVPVEPQGLQSAQPAPWSRVALPAVSAVDAVAAVVADACREVVEMLRPAVVVEDDLASVFHLPAAVVDFEPLSLPNKESGT